MLECFCRNCCHIWLEESQDIDPCPECNSVDIFVDDNGTIMDNGYYEGDFPPYLTDSQIGDD